MLGTQNKAGRLIQTQAALSAIAEVAAAAILPHATFKRAGFFLD